jgi:aldose 1-epimerase
MQQTPRFSVDQAPALARGQSGYVLRDRQTGAEARIVPALGANLVGLRLAVRGQTVEVMAPEPPADMPAQRFGAPVLFPYPNRVRAARYTWQGRRYPLPATAGGHAIHGLVLHQPFAVTARAATDRSAALTCAISAADAPALAQHYPFAFRLSLTYTLGAGGLRTQAEIANDGAEPMPFGLGFHPFFRLPLVEGGRREDCRVLLWAPQIWELDADRLPTGRLLPVPAHLDARGYPRLGDTVFDTLYTRLALDDPGAGAWSSRYLDPAAGVEVVVIADAAFREAVLFAPPTRPVLCIEPYTCATDALNLQARGIDAGLLALGPGERWTAGYTIAARAVRDALVGGFSSCVISLDSHLVAC